MHTRCTFLSHAHCTTNTLSSPIIPITHGLPRHPPAPLDPFIANVNNPKQKSRKTKQSSRRYTLLSDKKVKIIVNNQKFFLTPRTFLCFSRAQKPLSQHLPCRLTRPLSPTDAMHLPSPHRRPICIFSPLGLYTRQHLVFPPPLPSQSAPILSRLRLLSPRGQQLPVLTLKTATIRP